MKIKKVKFFDSLGDVQGVRVNEIFAVGNRLYQASRADGQESSAQGIELVPDTFTLLDN